MNSSLDRSYIYGLTDPTNTIRYIGQSINPRKRFCQHIVESRYSYSTSPVYQWIRTLTAISLRPGLIILGRYLVEDIVHQEARFIRQFQGQLLNKRPAGPIGFRGNMLIECLETRERFSSYAAIQRRHSCPIQSIKDSCSSGKSNTHCDLHFRKL